MSFTRTAQVFTTAGEGVLLLLSFTGTEAISRPFEFDVDVLSTDEAFDLSSLLGQPMSVVLELSDGGIREFNGIVTRFALVGEVHRYVRYRATLRPWFWLLSRTTNCRIFQNQTVPEVLKTLFREHGFSDVEELFSTEYRTWEYLVQYRESDFNFASRMMEQEGIYYYFKHKEGKHTLVLCDSYSAHEGVEGYSLVPYFPPGESEARERDHVDSWRAMRQITAGAFSSLDYDFERPKAKLGSQLKRKHEHQYGEYELYDYPGEFHDTTEADEQVKIRLEAEQVEYDLVRGAGNARGIAPGALMTLTDYPRPDQNKEYLILTANYDLRIDNYESIGTGNEGPVYRCAFSAMDSKQPYRAARTTRKPIVEGPQTALVVGQAEQEIWTDEYGRVKVQFHWDRYGQSDENSSCWVRVAQLWAGSGWGGIHIPRIGQEVIVDFLEGDPDRPVVVGRLYNADNMPPYTLPENQTQSGIKSHSTKEGGVDNFNEIRFEDKKGEESVNIQAEKDMTTLVKNNQTNTIQASRSSSTGGSDSVSVGGDRSLSVTGARTVTVTKSDTEDYKDTRLTTVKGPDTLKITNAHDGTYGAARTATITGLDTTTAKGGKKTDVTGLYDITASTKYHVKQGANELTLEGAKATLTNGSSTITLDGGKITISAPEQISIMVGSSGITITTDTVAIAGTSAASMSGAEAGSLVVDGQGANVGGPKVVVSGQSTVEISGAMVKVN